MWRSCEFRLCHALNVPSLPVSARLSRAFVETAGDTGEACGLALLLCCADTPAELFVLSARAVVACD